MTLGHTIGVALGIAAAMLAAFQAAAPITDYTQWGAALVAALAAGSTMLQYYFPPGVGEPQPPQPPSP